MDTERRCEAAGAAAEKRISQKEIGNPLQRRTAGIWDADALHATDCILSGAAVDQRRK
jgi:hypothetical protein